MPAKKQQRKMVNIKGKSIEISRNSSPVIINSDGVTYTSPITLKAKGHDGHVGRNFLIRYFCLFITLLIVSNIKAQNTMNQSTSLYESQVKKFKPEQGLTARNYNDVRVFVYDWFTHFEHASTVDFYLSHLEENNLAISFPGQVALSSRSEFEKWYNNLLTQTLWNFHDLSKIQVKRTASQEYLVSFIVDWYGEVKSSSDQLAGWQSRKDSHLYHYILRQTWTMKELNNKFFIQKLLVTSGDTPSPVID